MKKKLIAAYIIENEKLALPLSLQSIIDHVDEVIIIDGGSVDGTLNYIEEIQKKYPGKIRLYCNDYPHSDKGANGKQRNKYLKIIQEDFPEQWCLALDADEVVDDNIKNLRFFLESIDKNDNFSLRNVDDNKYQQDICVNLKMRHCIQDLAHEDSTVELHRVFHRLFRITDDLYYPEVEHPVLSSIKPVEKFNTIIPEGHDAQFLPTIWHLGYCRDIYSLKKKYENHLEKSNIHAPDFLKWWYRAHLFGEYPRKSFDVLELPKVIKDFFLINDIDDEIYFKNRKELEAKHFLDSAAMISYFKLNNESKVMFVGDGCGLRTFAMLTYGVDSVGFDISKYAVDNSPYKSMLGDRLYVGDIVSDNFKPNKFYNLVVCYDVLEHLYPNDLDKAIEHCIGMSKKYIMVSVPVIGDPNLLNDKTHRIHGTKEWWLEQFTKKGCKLLETPEWFPYKSQIFIFTIPE